MSSSSVKTTWAHWYHVNVHSSTNKLSFLRLSFLYHFRGVSRVALCLCVLWVFVRNHCNIWKCVSSVSSFSCKSNSFPWEKFCARTRFKTVEKGNWEMAYCFPMIRHLWYNKTLNLKAFNKFTNLVRPQIVAVQQEQLSQRQQWRY